MADRSILVVDDNEINRGILGEIFKDKYNIIEAGDGTRSHQYHEGEKRRPWRRFSLILSCLRWMDMLCWNRWARWIT
ncbi:response regulator [Butyrivibrio sp. FCS014]|uniref:response regulator n=1 Tax=Butyrivibrio sp. FCS014 TaxID=1408304 RepID=UPI001FA748CF|nr:response regulator [Butyrivibrio sp. FCS014]